MCASTTANHHTPPMAAVTVGLDLYSVVRLLGHADIGSTERYAHLADGHFREPAGRVFEIVGGALAGGRKREAGGGRRLMRVIS